VVRVPVPRPGYDGAVVLLDGPVRAVEVLTWQNTVEEIVLDGELDVELDQGPRRVGYVPVTRSRRWSRSRLT